MLHAVIMAGGSGTRFWPASRLLTPKQLLPLAGETTMIQDTVHRLGAAIPPENVLVVTNERLVEPIRQQLPCVPADRIVGEPCKRDTAPCVALAAEWVLREDPDATMVVMPADHVISPNEVFQQALADAAGLVDDDPTRLITFGIKPTYAAETFGYIERGEPLSGGPPLITETSAYQVLRFREKPKGDTAREYYESGRFFWNSGIFVWKAATVLSALETFEPEIYARTRAIGEAMGTPEFEAVFHSEFEAIQGTSIDYAVMERHDNVVVIEAPFQWDDLGNWQSLPRLRGSNADGNTVVANRSLEIDTKNTIIRSEGDHLIVTVGLEDCIVVHTPGATLVAHRDQEEAIRKVVPTIKEKGWDEYL